MSLTKIYVIIMLLLMGAVPSCAQVEKYDTRIDSEIEFENRVSQSHVSKPIYSDELEDRILDKVWDLPEVQKRNDYLKHVSKGKRELGIVMYQRHIGESDYYWVKVGEDFGGIIVSHFDFYVEPKTLTIKFYNAERDAVIDLAVWRKNLSR